MLSPPGDHQSITDRDVCGHKHLVSVVSVYSERWQEDRRPGQKKKKDQKEQVQEAEQVEQCGAECWQR